MAGGHIESSAVEVDGVDEVLLIAKAASRRLHPLNPDVPAQCEQLGDALLAGFFQPRDRESFKQHREAAGDLGSRQSHHPRPVLGAVAARRPGMQNRAVLASVEMTPTALGLMIMEPALGAALGTAPAHLFIVFEEDMDFAAGPVQLHAFDFPGTLNA